MSAMAYVSIFIYANLHTFNMHMMHTHTKLADLASYQSEGEGHSPNQLGSTSSQLCREKEAEGRWGELPALQMENRYRPFCTNGQGKCTNASCERNFPCSGCWEGSLLSSAIRAAASMNRLHYEPLGYSGKIFNYVSGTLPLGSEFLYSSGPSESLASCLLPLQLQLLLPSSSHRSENSLSFRTTAAADRLC